MPDSYGTIERRSLYIEEEYFPDISIHQRRQRSSANGRSTHFFKIYINNHVVR